MRCVNSPSLRFSGVKELEGPLLHPRARANSVIEYALVSTVGGGGADCAQSPYSFESEHEKLRPILLVHGKHAVGQEPMSRTSSDLQVETGSRNEESGGEEQSPHGWGLMRSTVNRFRNVSPSSTASPSSPTSPSSASSPTAPRSSLAALVRRKSLEKAIGGSSEDNRFWEQDGYKRPESVLALAANDAKGTPFDFAALVGKVTIFVNVATL
jgi:hypothetical protein